MSTKPPDRRATGRLVRDTDVTGISGTGPVADVVIWSDGTSAIRWLGDYPTTVHHDHGLESINHIHGHGGATRIVWDNPQSEPPDLRAVLGRLTNVLQGDLEGWPDKTRWEDVWALVRDVRPLIDDVAALRDELASLKVKQAETYRCAQDFHEDLTEAEDALTEHEAAGHAQAAALQAATTALDAARTAMEAAHREHTAAATNWRIRIGEAADILDIAGHHTAAAEVRRDASIPPKTLRSAYADNGLPVPLEDRHRDALATIALTDPGAPATHAAALIDLARTALGLDTPQETPRG